MQRPAFILGWGFGELGLGLEETLHFPHYPGDVEYLEYPYRSTVPHIH